MNQDTVKTLLLKLKTSDTDFSIIFSGKKSGKVNGLYKPATHEIILHDKNFENDNELMYTAIHEYAHHIMCCKYPVTPPKHNNEFGATMHDLIDIAIKKNIYKRYKNDEAKQEIEKLISEAQTIEREIAALYRKLGAVLNTLHAVSKTHHIRYEDIIERGCGITMKTARMALQSAELNIDASIGQDMQASIIRAPVATDKEVLIEKAKKGTTIYQNKQAAQASKRREKSIAEQLVCEQLRNAPYTKNAAENVYEKVKGDML